MNLADAVRVLATRGPASAASVQPAAQCAALWVLPQDALAAWNQSLHRNDDAVRWQRQAAADGVASLGLVCAGRHAAVTLATLPGWTAQGIALGELARLPPLLRRAAYAHEAQPLIDALSAALGTPPSTALTAEIEVAEPPPLSARAWHLGFQVAAPAGPAGALSFEPADAAFWLQAVAFGQPPPTAPRFTSAPLRAELVLPRLQIPSAQWQNLQAGGALLTGLRAEAAMAAQLRLPTLKAAIEGQFSQQQFCVRGRFVMSEATSRPPAGAGLTEALAQAPVAVDIQLEVAPVTLAQVLQWVPGSVFELGPQAAAGEVSITANGERFGTGRLVSLGDTLAVQVLRIDGDGSERT
jgi:flagellar motor switch/type III secretory pathway protein FliN